MNYKNLLIALSLLLSANLALAMKSQITAQIRLPFETNQLHADFANQPVVFLKNLIAKQPNDFDGQVDLFTALAIDKALQDAAANSNSFDIGLRDQLTNQGDFDNARDTVNTYNKKKNKSVFHGAPDIMELYNSLSPNKGNIISLELITHPDDKTINVVNRWEYGDYDKQQTLNDIKQRIEKLRGKANQVTHFLGFDGYQHVLYSVVTDNNKKAKLYITVPLATQINPNIRKYVDYFLPLVENINK